MINFIYAKSSLALGNKSNLCALFYQSQRTFIYKALSMLNTTQLRTIRGLLHISFLMKRKTNNIPGIGLVFFISRGILFINLFLILPTRQHNPIGSHFHPSNTCE